MSTLAIITICLVGLVVITYLIIRPLIAIGDMPQKIDDLTNAVLDLSDVVKTRHRADVNKEEAHEENKVL